ncbi:MAG TPA: immunoglobulin domain-containing protein [Candidatus Hydrogenedentes bacterium]|nr:immunoglobulin domain-containing protein [Candidatus Hydrogenedentota bacterium]
MKKMAFLMILMLAAVPALAQYTPVPGPDGAGCNPMGAGSTPYAPLPTWNLPGAYDDPILTWPPDGSYDFCATLDTLYCSLYELGNLSPSILESVAPFAGLVQCLNADINGPVDPQAQIPVTANGVPDGQYELGVLAKALNDAANPYHAEALAKFQSNFFNIKVLIEEALANVPMKADLRGVVPAIAPHLPGALVYVLAGFATLDDPTTNAALDQLLGLLSDIGITPPPGGIATITDGVAALGPYGDADGDGFTNKTEYDYFVGDQGFSPAQYVAAVFDPAQTPPDIFPSVNITGPARVKIEEGSTLTLNTSVRNVTGTITYQWFKDNAPLAGQTGSSLVIPNVTQADAGSYTVQIDVPDTKSIYISNPVIVQVLAQLPVAGGLGLALVAGACALAGIAGMRRK